MEQIPTKILPDVMKNTATQVAHRLSSLSDRELIAGTMNMSDSQAESLASLAPGTAAVFREGMDKPVSVQVHFTAPSDTKPLDLGTSLRIARNELRTCSQECQSNALCTVRDFADADRFIAESPELLVWIELCFLTMALETKKLRLPRPSERLTQIGSDRTSLRQACLLERTIVDTVRLRWKAVAEFTDPDEFIYVIRSHAEHFLDLEAGSKPPAFMPSPVGGLSIRLGMQTATGLKAKAQAHRELRSGALAGYDGDGLLVSGASAADVKLRIDKLVEDWALHDPSMTLEVALEESIHKADREPMLGLVEMLRVAFSTEVDGGSTRV